jgi:transcription factor SPN1
MEDLPVSDDSPIHSPLPQAGHDPGDPLAPEIEEEDSTPNPPINNPREDMELTGENEVDKDEDEDEDDFSDNESILSDVDEAQFDDFDPTAIAVEDRPQVAVDDSNVKLLGVHKRKRTEAEIEESRKKKRKDRAREKTRKPRKERDGSEPFSGGEELSGKRSRKRKEGGEKSSSRKAVPDEVDEESLTPEESMSKQECCRSGRRSVLTSHRTETRSGSNHGCCTKESKCTTEEEGWHCM